MATTSTLPAVKAALVTLLQGRSALSGVSVTYAWNGSASKPEMMFLTRPPAEPTRGRSDLLTFRVTRMGRRERYTVPVTIRVAQGGVAASDAAATEARAFALLAELESAVAADPTANGTANKVSVGDYESDLEPYEKGWKAEIIASLECEAVLT